MVKLQLTFDQFRVIQQKLPHGYHLLKRPKLAQLDYGRDELLDESQLGEDSQGQKKFKRQDSQFQRFPQHNLDDLRTCQNILTKVKKTGSYKLLTSEDLKETFSKYFTRSFYKLESFYKKSKNDKLLNNDYIVASFWNDFHKMIKDCQLLAQKDQKVHQTTIEMENQFNLIFINYQPQCLEQTANMQLAKLDAQIKGISSPFVAFNHIHNIDKSRNQNGTKEQAELYEKIKKLPLYNLKYLIDIAGLQACSAEEVDLNSVDINKFYKLHSVFKQRVDRFKKVKLGKRARKNAKMIQVQNNIQNEFNKDIEAQNFEYNEYSNLSFLSSSEDIEIEEVNQLY